MLKIITTLFDILPKERSAPLVSDLIKLCVKERDIDSLLFLDKHTNGYNEDIAKVILNSDDVDKLKKFWNLRLDDEKNEGVSQTYSENYLNIVIDECPNLPSSDEESTARHPKLFPAI